MFFIFHNGELSNTRLLLFLSATSIDTTRSFFVSGNHPIDLRDRRVYCSVPAWISERSCVRFSIAKSRLQSVEKINNYVNFPRSSNGFQLRVINETQGEVTDEDEDLCPVECVREFKTDEEFLKIIERAKETKSLVVVDFFRTSCGSCKYIEQGFAKLCKGSGDQEASVIFLKHNVIDEYDEQSEVAERLRIKTVPLFHFYKDGTLLEAFPTRDKDRILEAIRKYSSPLL